MRFQTKSDIQILLAESGARPRRQWGQNFLIDGNLMGRLLAAADIAKNDVVLEVGVGTGSLTEHLVAAAGAVVAVEIDPVMYDIVQRRLGDSDHLTLILGDVLQSKHQIDPIVLQALETAHAKTGGQIMLVANLPYNIATPLLMNLLLSSLSISRFCFTVQREMADRLIAPPRTKDYGPVSVLVQATCKVQRVAALPPSVFWPAPAVESAMVRADVTNNPFGSDRALIEFAKLVHAGFAHRRKTLRYNLQKGMKEEDRQALAAAVDLSRRAEELTVDEWIELGKRRVQHSPPTE